VHFVGLFSSSSLKMHGPKKKTNKQTNKQNSQHSTSKMYSVGYLYINATLSIATCFGPQWIIFREQLANNIALN